jgi:hypothetical protein
MERQELLRKTAYVLSLIEKYEAMHQVHHANRYRKVYEAMKKDLA